MHGRASGTAAEVSAGRHSIAQVFETSLFEVNKPQERIKGLAMHEDGVPYIEVSKFCSCPRFRTNASANSDPNAPCIRGPCANQTHCDWLYALMQHCTPQGTAARLDVHVVYSLQDHVGRLRRLSRTCLLQLRWVEAPRTIAFRRQSRLCALPQARGCPPHALAEALRGFLNSDVPGKYVIPASMFSHELASKLAPRFMGQEMVLIIDVKDKEASSQPTLHHPAVHHSRGIHPDAHNHTLRNNDAAQQLPSCSSHHTLLLSRCCRSQQYVLRTAEQTSRLSGRNTTGFELLGCNTTDRPAPSMQLPTPPEHISIVIDGAKAIMKYHLLEDIIPAAARAGELVPGDMWALRYTDRKAFAGGLAASIGLLQLEDITVTGGLLQLAQPSKPGPQHTSRRSHFFKFFVPKSKLASILSIGGFAVTLRDEPHATFLPVDESWLQLHARLVAAVKAKSQPVATSVPAKSGKKAQYIPFVRTHATATVLPPIDNSNHVPCPCLRPQSATACPSIARSLAPASSPTLTLSIVRVIASRKHYPDNPTPSGYCMTPYPTLHIRPHYSLAPEAVPSDRIDMSAYRMASAVPPQPRPLAPPAARYLEYLIAALCCLAGLRFELLISSVTVSATRRTRQRYRAGPSAAQRLLRGGADPSSAATAARHVPPGFRLVNIVGDGHCLFRARTQGLEGEQNGHWLLRERIAAHVREFWFEYEDHINATYFYDDAQPDAERYIQMLLSTTHTLEGCDAEARIAAHIHNVCIAVHKSTDSELRLFDIR